MLSRSDNTTHEHDRALSIPDPERDISRGRYATGIGVVRGEEKVVRLLMHARNASRLPLSHLDVDEETEWESNTSEVSTCIPH